MTDVNSIFEQTAPPIADPVSNGAGKQKRKRGPRRTAAASPLPARPPGRPRKVAASPPQAGKPAAGRAKFDLSKTINALVGLTAADAALVDRIVTALQATSKKSRLRVLTAVARIFA